MQVDNTTVDIPLALASSSEGPDLDLDFTLTLGNKVRLYNPALYDLMVNGSVTFQGNLNHPHPSGRFEAMRGTVHYLDTNFRVTKLRPISHGMIPSCPMSTLKASAASASTMSC